MMVAEYRRALPEEKVRIAELEKPQRSLELKTINSDTSPKNPLFDESRRRLVSSLIESKPKGGSMPIERETNPRNR